MNHAHQRRAHTPQQRGLPLAILDFVAWPQQSLTVFLIGRQRRWKALSIPLALLCVLPGSTGCRTASSSPEQPSRATVRQAAQSKEEAERQQLEQIPPPSKTRYLSVRTKDAYSNPFLVVHPETVTLTIIYPDQDPNGFGAGGILRPAKARKQEVDVRLSDLPEALASLSPEVWPYGRVVAIEESPTAPRKERVAIRRNVETAIQMLNDLGIVVDEWTGSNGAVLR